MYLIVDKLIIMGLSHVINHNYLLIVTCS